jgi:general nucleoside transport system permease protein
LNILDNILTVSFLLQVIRLFTPYYLGATAANFSERAGVINIAIEGFLVSGAFCFAMFSIVIGNPFIAILLTITVNLIFSSVFALFVTKLKINHIIIGVGFNLFFVGMAKFLLMVIFQSSSNTPRINDVPEIPLLSKIPYAGEILGDFIILFAFALIFLSGFILFKTKFGLRLRSAGENPEAAESLGVKVRNYKLYSLLISGFITALAGIWLAGNQNSFSDGMIAGRGYIALAAMIIGKWNPVKIFFACLLFAFFESFEIFVQLSGVPVPSQIIQITPYLITILVLVLFVSKTKPPAADGLEY